MTELEKAAEEYVKNRNYSDANEGYSPGEVEFECEAAFKAGAEWQANQSPWISVEERLPERHMGVFFIVQCADVTSYHVGFCGTRGEWETYHNMIFLPDSKYARVTHWMLIPE